MAKRGRAAALSVRIGPLALALLPLALFACGEDEEPAQDRPNATRKSGSDLAGAEARQAEGTLRGYFDARAEDRWARACSYLTDSTRELVERAAAGPGGIPGTDCPSFIASSTRRLPPAERAALDQITIDSVRGSGDRGYVLYRAFGGELVMPIRAEGGSWKLASLNGSSRATS